MSKQGWKISFSEAQPLQRCPNACLSCWAVTPKPLDCVSSAPERNKAWPAGAQARKVSLDWVERPDESGRGPSAMQNSLQIGGSELPESVAQVGKELRMYRGDDSSGTRHQRPRQGAGAPVAPGLSHGRGCRGDHGSQRPWSLRQLCCIHRAQ